MTSFGYCRDCQHWGQRNFTTPGITNFDLRETGFCQLSVSNSAGALMAESLAVAADHEGYKAMLITRPNFGCVQFSSSSSPEAD
jgi:hypothetical protein